MAMMNPDDLNPFQAPSATIGAPTLTGATGDAELIRRTYLTHEASVKGIGSLSYLGAFFCVLGLIAFGLGAVGLINPPQNNNNSEMNPRLLFGIFAGIAIVLLVIYGGMGYGLRNLQPWARWTTVALIGLSFLLNLVQIVAALAISPAMAAGALLGTLIGSIIPGYVLYLMLSAKGAMVFSSEYREVIRQTPSIKYKTSIIVKIFLGLLLFVLLLAVAGGILSAFMGR